MDGAAIKRLASFVVVAGGWLLAGIRLTLDLIGWSTAPDDVNVAASRLDQFFLWLLALPWWLPWGYATFATGFLMWFSWPRHTHSPSIGNSQASMQLPSLPQAVPAVTPPTQKPIETPYIDVRPRPQLPTYEIEKQLRAIDGIWDLVSVEMGKVLEGTEGLPSNWWNAWRDPTNNPNYSEKISTLPGRLRELVTEIEGFRSKYPQYQEIIVTCQPVFWNTAIPKIENFATTFMQLAQYFKSDTPNDVFVRYMQQPRNDLTAALMELHAWRNKTIGNLSTIREQLIG